MQNNYIIYILYNTLNNLTYVGMTNNQIRRLRQHNGELVGGAKYTTSKKGLGEWNYYGWIYSDTELIKNRALSIEKKIQIKSRRLTGTPIERRMKAVNFYLLENPDLHFILNSNNIIIDNNEK
jgi:predicted GIY-YIG superfamily endonuclease